MHEHNTQVKQGGWVKYAGDCKKSGRANNVEIGPT